MENRRAHVRHDISIPVLLLLDGREVEAKTQNIGLGGMYILTSEPLPYGAKLKVRFRLPAHKEEALVEVTVRWKQPDGVGVQFGSLRAVEVWALNQLFKK
jgi:hypothetical protein